MFLIVFVFFLVAVLIAVGPHITIWALNTLFPVLQIQHSLGTWFAILWISGAFAGLIKGLFASVKD
jgi:hypothetical protein